MVSGPWDNVTLPGPPNGPAWVQAAAQMMGATGNAVNQGFGAYQRGQQFQNQQQEFQYAQRLRDLFQNPDNAGMLQDSLKSMGLNSPLIQKLIETEGAAGLQQFIPQLLASQGAKLTADALNGGGGNVNTSPSAQTADALTRAAQPQGSSSPKIPYSNPATLSATGSDNAGAETVRSLTAAIAGGRPVTEASIANYARALKVDDPDAPLSTDQEAQARTIIGNSLRRQGSSQSAPPPTRDVASGGPPPINAASANQGNESPVVGAGGGPAISPAPTTGAGGIQPSGAPVARTQSPENVPATVSERFGAAYGPPSEADIQAREMRAQRALTTAADPRVDQGRRDLLKDFANKELDAAKQMREERSKYFEPDRTTKAVLSGAAKQEALDKNDIERYGKKYDNLQHQADEAYKLVQTSRLSKSLMDDPNFYSGVGADHVLTMQRFAVNLGLKPQDYALANEVFGKTVSASILEQIRSLGGQGLGQVRVAEINVMKGAAENHDNTPASNRLLNEVNDRMAERWTIPIAREAQTYKGGHLDAGFDRWVANYINHTPLLSKEELTDPRRIAPPLARTPADLKKIGWKDGDPFRDPDGNIYTHLKQ